MGSWCSTSVQVQLRETRRSRVCRVTPLQRGDKPGGRPYVSPNRKRDKQRTKPQGQGDEHGADEYIEYLTAKAMSPVPGPERKPAR